MVSAYDRIVAYSFSLEGRAHDKFQVNRRAIGSAAVAIGTASRVHASCRATPRPRDRTPGRRLAAPSPCLDVCRRRACPRRNSTSSTSSMRSRHLSKANWPLRFFPSHVRLPNIFSVVPSPRPFGWRVSRWRGIPPKLRD